MNLENEEFANVGHANDPLARLSAVLEIWRDKLVSFDGRNRQLYYRRLKSGDVDFNEKEIDKSVVKLLLADKTVKVSTLYPDLFNKVKPKSKVDLSIDENLDLDLEADEDEDLDFAELWAKKLRKFEAVYRKAKENYDEKNIETCFLAEGFITWKTLKPGPVPHAPLILHPIKIEPTARGNSDFSVTKTGEAFYNQALVLYLQKDFGIDPALFENETDLGIGKESLKPVLLALQESVT